MTFANSNENDGGDPESAPCKIVVGGGFGAGKTTLIGAISEVRPLRTEETLTSASVGFDDAFLYRELTLPIAERSLPTTGVPALRPHARTAFERWAATDDKTEY